MDEHPYGATAATQCCSTPQLQQQQPPLQQLQQAQCLWEEGAWPEQSWVQQDSLAIQATLPAWASPPFHITTKGSSKRGCSGHKLEGEGAPGVTALQHSLEHCHLTSPVLQLQGQWAANLQGALAVSHMQLTGASAHSMSEQPQHQQKQPAPNQQQQQQQPLEAPNWLRKLLTANAAAPLGQLTQLDLSLEQLPGLHGLGVLCPQLTSFAVNMNGLRSIEGLQGCSGLVQLSALVSLQFDRRAPAARFVLRPILPTCVQSMWCQLLCCQWFQVNKHQLCPLSPMCVTVLSFVLCVLCRTTSSSSSQISLAIRG